MQYSFREDSGVLVVKIIDERATVDFAGTLKEELLKRIESGSKNVVVDLSTTEFIDSSFMGTLVAGIKKSTLKAGDLKIVGLTPPVRASFELTRLYRIFDIFENIDDAINSF